MVQFTFRPADGTLAAWRDRVRAALAVHAECWSGLAARETFSGRIRVSVHARFAPGKQAAFLALFGPGVQS